VGIRSSRLRVCGAVVAPVLLALGWTPAARAAGSGAPIPAVPASTTAVASTASSVTQTVESAASAAPVPKSPAVPVVRHVVKRVAPPLAPVAPATPTSTHVAPPVVPAAKAGNTTSTAAKRAVPSRRHHAAQAADRAPKRLAGGAVPRAATHPRATKRLSPAVRVVVRMPGQPPGFFSGANAAGGSGLALLVVALAAAFSALAAPGLGRRLMPSIADGRDCALTLDLERPD
jgi:hypothetical protein